MISAFRAKFLSKEILCELERSSYRDRKLFFTIIFLRNGTSKKKVLLAGFEKLLLLLYIYSTESWKCSITIPEWWNF